MKTIAATNLYNALADSILAAAGTHLGYSRTDLDRVVDALAMGDDLHRLILDTLCCAACGPVATWQTYAAKAASEIASAISERESATGLRLDMTKA